jgi:hypothetical protein
MFEARHAGQRYDNSTYPTYPVTQHANLQVSLGHLRKCHVPERLVHLFVPSEIYGRSPGNFNSIHILQILLAKTTRELLGALFDAAEFEPGVEVSGMLRVELALAAEPLDSPFDAPTGLAFGDVILSEYVLVNRVSSLPRFFSNTITVYGMFTYGSNS